MVPGKEDSEMKYWGKEQLLENLGNSKDKKPGKTSWEEQGELEQG